MSLVAQAVSHAREVRHRLNNPQRVVEDIGIDLKRKPRCDEPGHEQKGDHSWCNATIQRLYGEIEELKRINAEMVGLSMTRRAGPQMKDIQRAVAKFYGFTPDELASPYRQASLVHARHVAMWLCKKIRLASYPEIGRAFANRDHTTALSAVKRIEKLRLADKELDTRLAAFVEMFVPAV